MTSNTATDGQLASLGTIVRRMEEQLEEFPPGEDATQLVWQHFDRAYLIARPDYRLWRLLQRPYFWLSGKKPHLRPRSTSYHQVSFRPWNRIRNIIPSAGYLKEMPSAVRWGISGVLIDYLHQRRVLAKVPSDSPGADQNSSDASEPTVPVDNDLSNLQGIDDALLDIANVLAEDDYLQNPYQSAMFLCVLSHIAGAVRDRTPDSPMWTGFPRLVEDALKAIDPGFQIHVPRRVPSLSLASLSFSASRVSGIMPTRDRAFFEMLCECLVNISRLLTDCACACTDNDPYPMDLMRLRAFLLAAVSEQYGRWREQSIKTLMEEAERTKAGTEFYVSRQRRTLYWAAGAAELTEDFFLAAKLWSDYIFLWYEGSGAPPPPNGCYRAVKDAGLMTHPKTPNPGHRVRHNGRLRRA